MAASYPGRGAALASLIPALAVAAIALAWAVIGAAWYLNRGWFAFTRDAFSDLGGAGSCCPGVYNYGLMAVGAVIVALGAAMLAASRGRLEAAGAAYMALAGVFLALIGYYHSGTRPHVFVSTWFFVQADLALALSSAGLALRGSRLALASLAVALAAFPVAGLVGATVGWPSAAVLEAYGVILIDFMVAVVALEYRRLARGARHLGAQGQGWQAG
ncbi:MAG: DUF998 domain-containing protein [Desulfurococcales archaeon]|nr:DUF998 domain-containing protein [Desulfurococcales archaeon]